MKKRIPFKIMKKFTPKTEKRFTNEFVQYFDQEANLLNAVKINVFIIQSLKVFWVV